MLETSYEFGDLIPSFDNGSPKPHSLGSRLGLPRQGLGIPLSKVGFPIRKSADQSLFAAPHGLSQRTTSFIASQRQGIHQMPLSHLIALIINAHPLGSGSGRAFDERFDRLALNRKTSLLRIVPTACGQAADTALATRSHARRFSSPCDVTTFNARRLRIDRDMCRARLSERSYLFTMSDEHAPAASLSAR